MSYHARGPDLGEFYEMAGDIAAFIAFWATMIYGVVAYGFFLGLAIGWIPALFIAAAARYMWPLALVLLIVLLSYL